MELLKERIRKEGKILPGNIVKVDGFLNHRIDVPLMEQIAQEFRRVFAGKDITLVLTAEASGIALATICAQAFGVPMVFAKKAKSQTTSRAASTKATFFPIPIKRRSRCSSPRSGSAPRTRSSSSTTSWRAVRPCAACATS